MQSEIEEAVITDLHILRQLWYLISIPFLNAVLMSKLQILFPLATGTTASLLDPKNFQSNWLPPGLLLTYLHSLRFTAKPIY